MKGREAKAGPSADLLLCFPSRPHWTVTPKAICAPDDRRRHLRKLSTGAAGQVRPLLWVKAKSAASETAEPSSPKVTCSGQIKVRQNTSACRNCQSVTDEIEKIHDAGKQKKRSNWAESLRFKREIMQFLTCLRTLRFDMRCFGSFPTADNTAEDDDEEEEECYRENHVGIEETSDDAARAVFSKWFMMLQEKQNNVFQGEAATNEDDVSDDVSIAEPAVPPPNALLLMRSRSAPAKSWIKENEDQEKEDRARAEEGKEKDQQTSMQSMRLLMEKEETKNENTRAMRYDSDFHCMSWDIVKESWMVGRLRDPLSKSRSWTR
ncbi:uncharacterized protein LOC114729085 [Neltuma alba]|uniref:uncharacterized protein LOC114729085 n=1 Tax=Neltuma alba TaxID=207710 RepID=UPI0010A350D9|nr:uncharacterized protein LOC114729085 [Prosopis alba]